MRHKIRIELTPEQWKLVESFWIENGTPGGAMMAQPKISESLLKISIFTPAEAEEIAKLVAKFEK